MEKHGIPAVGDQPRLPGSASVGPTTRLPGPSALKPLERRPLKKSILTWWMRMTKVEERRRVEDEMAF